MGNITLNTDKNLSEYRKSNSFIQINQKNNIKFNQTQTGNHSIGMNSLKNKNNFKDFKFGNGKDNNFIKSNDKRNSEKVNINPKIFQLIFPPPSKHNTRRSYKEKCNFKTRKDNNYIHSHSNQFSKNFNFINVLDESLFSDDYNKNYLNHTINNKELDCDINEDYFSFYRSNNENVNNEILDVNELCRRNLDFHQIKNKNTKKIIKISSDSNSSGSEFSKSKEFCEEKKKDYTSISQENTKPNTINEECNAVKSTEIFTAENPLNKDPIIINNTTKNSYIYQNSIEIDNKESFQSNNILGFEEKKSNKSEENYNISLHSEFSISPSEFELNFVKSSDELRRSYMAKLIYNNIWQPTKKQKDHNSLIIFDWDDTLLCTSFLTPNGVFLESMRTDKNESEKIINLDQLAFKILNLAISKSDTYIITNAEPGWVEYSAKRFYPKVHTILNKVKIVSARGEFEKIHPGDSRQWKIQTFLKMVDQFDTNLITNFICLGDSVIEMEAAHILASKFSQAFIKTIKFKESPSLDELTKQLNLVTDQFSMIFSSIKNLTIRVERKSRNREN